MKNKKLKLIDENKSPLFRIMSIYNSKSTNKIFANNICAFHVGNGIIVSVSHNLRSIDRLPAVISDDYYHTELVNKINSEDKPIFEKIYPILPGENERLLTLTLSQQPHVEQFAKKLDDAKVDRSYKKLYEKNCCKPFLLSSFRKNVFYNNQNLNIHFPDNRLLFESFNNRFTFFIELELLDILNNEDVAIYKIVNTHQDVINQLPFAEVDFQLHDTGTPEYYCLQSAPFDNFGRIINEARIEGLIDNFSREEDILGNKYILDGIRYLINGYFRFGSSGAPYLIYDHESESFKINAIQSQASHIQLAINGKMDGNLQFINGVATPLSIVEKKLKQRIVESTSEINSN